MTRTTGTRCDPRSATDPAPFGHTMPGTGHLCPPSESGPLPGRPGRGLLLRRLGSEPRKGANPNRISSSGRDSPDRLRLAASLAGRGWTVSHGAELQPELQPWR